MIIEKLSRAIFDYIETAAGLPEIHYPNIDGDPSGTHIIVSILPATPISVGLKSLTQAHGIISVLVRTKEGTGPMQAAKYADTLLALFVRNTELSYDDIKIRIDKAGYVSAPLNGGGWYALPVTIPYNILYEG